jgi:hypothetical protein
MRTTAVTSAMSRSIRSSERASLARAHTGTRRRLICCNIYATPWLFNRAKRAPANCATKPGSGYARLAAQEGQPTMSASAVMLRGVECLAHVIGAEAGTVVELDQSLAHIDRLGEASRDRSGRKLRIALAPLRPCMTRGAFGGGYREADRWATFARFGLSNRHSERIHCRSPRAGRMRAHVDRLVR